MLHVPLPLDLRHRGGWFSIRWRVRAQPRWHPWRGPFEKIIHGNVCVLQCLRIRRPSQRQHGPPVGVRAAALSQEASPDHYAHRIVSPWDPDVLDGVCGNKRHRRRALPYLPDLPGGGIVDAPSGHGRLGYLFLGLCIRALFILSPCSPLSAGTKPSYLCGLAFISLLSVGALAWRLLALNEQMFGVCYRPACGAISPWRGTGEAHR